MFRTIVLLVDSAALTERALPLAACIARGCGSRLILLRMLPPPTYQGKGKSPGSSAGRADEQTRAEARAGLEELLQRSDLSGLEVTLQFGSGTDAPDLVAAVHSLQADLLIMCRAARTGLARWKREQYLAHIVRYAPAPVLLLPEQASLPAPTTPAHLLVPLDGSRLAEIALAPAASLVAALAAPAPGGLHLVRVISDQAQQRKAAAYLRVIAHRLRCSSLAQIVPSISWSVVCHLDVAEALCWLAERGEDAEWLTSWSMARDVPTPFERCDLVALTTHGRQGLERRTLGSVTERLIQWGRRALLIVPPPTAAEAGVPTAGEITEAELHAWLGVSRAGSSSASSLAFCPTRKNHLPFSTALTQKSRLA
jgi:nucleotide-binding universal stress UspA family protein